MTDKVCTDCQQQKPLAEFYEIQGYIDRLCKLCRRAFRKRHRIAKEAYFEAINQARGWA